MRGVRCKLIGLALVLMALALSGCLKVKFRFTVYPDASGKVEATMGLSRFLTSLDKLDDEPDGEPIVSALDLVGRMTENSEGVLWGETEEFTKGSHEYIKLTGYFEDLNAVRMGDTTYSWERLADGTFELSFSGESGEMPLDGGQNPLEDLDLEGGKEAATAFVRVMLSGLEIVQEFRLPGKVTEAEGLEVEEREARLALGIDDLLKILEEPEEAEGLFSGKIISGPPGDISEELAAFRKEMEGALAEAEKDVPGEPPPAQRERAKKRRVY